MNITIEQMSQDLARGEYAEDTRVRYCNAAQELVTYVGKPILEIEREELRGFVDKVTDSKVSASARA